MLKRRGKKSYWYAYERTDDGRVRRVYRAAGEAADEAAREQAERLALWDADREGARRAEEDHAEATAPLDDFTALLESATNAVLEGLGYHRHARGEWRMRRHGK